MADARSGPFLARAEATGVPVAILHSPGRNYLRDLQGVRRVMQGRDVSVIHTHGYRADVIGALAARAERRPHVATAHGFTGGTLRNRINQFVGAQGLRHADRVIAVSAQLVNLLHLRGVKPERIHLLPNAWLPPGPPLDRLGARQRLGLPAQGQFVGWVGRLSEEKGPDLAVAALGGAPQVEMVFVGSGPMQDELVRQAAREGVSSRIRWLGTVSNVWEVLPAFDVLLLSSRTEGTPMILLEAMHAGVPVVATPVGGVPNLLGGTAWLADAPSAPALQRALADALAEPAEARRRAHLASQRVASRGSDQWLDAHQALYASVAGECPA
jgi:glycosyltransferase involved in cell wall biosynthesis